METGSSNCAGLPPGRVFVNQRRAECLQGDGVCSHAGAMNEGHSDAVERRINIQANCSEAIVAALRCDVLAGIRGGRQTKENLDRHV